MHLSTCEQLLLACLGKIGTLESASQVWDGEVGGKGSSCFSDSVVAQFREERIGKPHSSAVECIR